MVVVVVVVVAGIGVVVVKAVVVVSIRYIEIEGVVVWLKIKGQLDRKLKLFETLASYNAVALHWRSGCIIGC